MFDVEPTMIVQISAAAAGGALIYRHQIVLVMSGLAKSILISVLPKQSIDDLIEVHGAARSHIKASSRKALESAQEIADRRLALKRKASAEARSLEIQNEERTAALNNSREREQRIAAALDELERVLSVLRQHGGEMMFDRESLQRLANPEHPPAVDLNVPFLHASGEVYEPTVLVNPPPKS